MEQAYFLGGLQRSVGVQGAAGVELPAARRMGHRQHGLLSLRVDGLPYPSQGGYGEEA